MNNETRIQTLRNVISDLETYLEMLEDFNSTESTDELWNDCKSACEYITEDIPLG